MFVLADNPTFTHTVELVVPIDGGYENQTLKATFRVLDTEHAESFDLSDTVQSTAFLTEVIERLDDIAGADDAPLPYSDKLRDRIIQLPFARGPLAKAYFVGVNKATVGN
jgi:hypothetical protein